ncbi:MAG: hypothetical protein ACJKSS_02560 [Patescibacteria group bacterium UBA2103]
MGAKRVEDIIPPSRRRMVEDEAVPAVNTYEPSNNGKKGRPLLTLILIIVAALIVGVGVAAMFAGAKVVVHPLEREVPVNTDLFATSTETDPLPFEIVRIEKVATQSVPADGSENVSERASGTVIVYNEFSSTPQRWVTNTRFESPDGKIFRVKEPVEIPGMKDGKPGTVEVTIYADEAGADYNVGLVDFTIPGLAGSPQFESLYAKAKTPMSGGFIGNRPVVSEEKAANTRISMQAALKDDLMDTIADQIPSGFTLLGDSVAFIPESLSNGEGEGSTAVLREKATAVALVFPTDLLAKAIAEKTIASYDDDNVTIGSTNTLMVSNLPSAGELVSADELTVSVEGSVNIVWKVSADQIKTEIAGKSRDAAETVLSNIPGIDTAELILRPFWRSNFPTDTEKITVSVNAS